MLELGMPLAVYEDLTTAWWVGLRELLRRFGVLIGACLLFQYGIP